MSLTILIAVAILVGLLTGGVALRRRAPPPSVLDGVLGLTAGAPGFVEGAVEGRPVVVQETGTATDRTLEVAVAGPARRFTLEVRPAPAHLRDATPAPATAFAVRARLGGDALAARARLAPDVVAALVADPAARWRVDGARLEANVPLGDAGREEAAQVVHRALRVAGTMFDDSLDEAEALAERVGESVPEDRATLLRGIGRRYPDHAATARAAEEALSDPRPDVRVAAAAILGRADVLAALALDGAIPEGLRGEAAAQAVAHGGMLGAEVLRAGLNGTLPPTVREGALAALAAPDPAVTDVLRTFVDALDADPPRAIVQRVALGLAAGGDAQDHARIQTLAPVIDPPTARILADAVARWGGAEAHATLDALAKAHREEGTASAVATARRALQAPRGTDPAG